MNITNQKRFILIIVILLIGNFYFFLQQQDSEYQLRFLKSIPRIELSNTLTFDSNIAQGKVIGFVAFKNTEKQPKNLKQYIVIEAQGIQGTNDQQVFTAQDVYAFNNLAPRYTDPYILKEVDNSINQLTLKDDAGNIFLIDKPTSKISWLDPQGDQSDLITSLTEHQNFLIEIYK
jgi:hypothetical protein